MAQRKVINDRYDLRPLTDAQGAMGEVWVGRDAKLDREVAVKFVRFQDGVPADELVKRFVRESRITARLQHPGVPAIFDVGTEDGRPYLVMQRVHGVSLRNVLARRDRLPIGWSCAIAAQVCSVLAAAHSASLVHRDLKPANLMLEADGTVKVLDFGLAVALSMTEGSQITRTGQHIGTPIYMAPEQVLAAMGSPQTDLYALGCTLHEMLTGTQVFTGNTAFAVMQQHVDSTPEPVRNLRPEVPAEVAELLGELLRKKPEERPASATETYHRLLPHVAGLGALPEVVDEPSRQSPQRMYAEVLSRAFTGVGASGGPERSRPDAVPSAPHPAAESAAPEAVSAADRAGASVREHPVSEPTRAGGAEGKGPAVPARDLREGESEASPLTRTRIDDVRAIAAELADQARYQEAAVALWDVVQRSRDVFSAFDPDVISARVEYANVLFEGGDYRAATPVYEELAADLAERDGPTAELVFRCRAQYVQCQAAMGVTSAALERAQQLVADELQAYGRRDPRTMELRRQIGVWQLGTGRHAEARATFEALQQDVHREFGEQHPMAAKVRDLLSDIPT
ncbi:serine/threonine-protein kinase [Salinifilum ghardaiensis]